MEMKHGTEGNEDRRSNAREAKGNSHQVAGVRRVLISDDVLDLLGELQRKTQPRMDMRYLVEGAITALAATPEGLQQVADHARQRLRQQLDGH